MAESADGTRIALHLSTGTYLRLNESAEQIVDLLTSTGDPDCAAADLALRFGLSERQARADVQFVIDRFGGLKRKSARGARRPRARTTVNEIRTWWALPFRRRIAVVQIVTVLGFVELGLRLSSLPALAKALGVPLATDSKAVSMVAAVSELQPGERIRLSGLDWALRRWIFDGTCLRRALVTGFVLRHRHPRLHLGLMEDGVTSHAWVEAEGRSHGASGSVSSVYVSSAGRVAG